METISAQEFAKRYGSETLSQVASSAPSAPKSPTLMDRIRGDVQTAGSAVSDAVAGTGRFEGQSPVNRGVNATAEAFNAIPKVASEVLPEQARQALDAVGGAIGKGVQSVADLFGSNPALQKWTIDHPDAFKALQETLSTASGAGNIAGDVLAVDGAAKAGNAAMDAGGVITRKIGSGAADLGAGGADAVTQSAETLKGQVQSVLAKKAVSPQLEQSANRLFLDGTQNVGDPVATYDAYLAQSEKDAKDIKADPAIATVGSEMGDAFKTVVQQRREVGKVIGDELKKVGGLKVDLGDAFTKFETALHDSGITYNGEAGKLVLGDTAKIAPEEAAIIEKYIGELNKIGANPTVAQVDGLLGRMDSIIQYDKSAKGITSVTNGERLIKGSLSDLRSSLTDSGNPELKPYADARSAYSELSGFINDGAQYLGKITSSGDFAKDASLAKSAVQSILNNGKKDWLLKLEALTGQPLLDKAVLALQAMKDAGDFRGNSLLETLSGGSIPMSKMGVASKILNFAVKQGANAVVGSPADQTRKFLNDLGKTSQP